MTTVAVVVSLLLALAILIMLAVSLENTKLVREARRLEKLIVGYEKTNKELLSEAEEAYTTHQETVQTLHKNIASITAVRHAAAEELTQVVEDFNAEREGLLNTIQEQSAVIQEKADSNVDLSKRVRALEDLRAANEKYWVHNDQQQREWLADQSTKIVEKDAQIKNLQRLNDNQRQQIEADVATIQRLNGLHANQFNIIQEERAASIRFQESLAAEVAASEVSAKIIADLRKELSERRTQTAIANQPLADWERELLGKPLPECIPVHFIFGSTYVTSEDFMELQKRHEKAKKNVKRYRALLSDANATIKIEQEYCQEHHIPSKFPRA